ncbi:hypothetical protein [Luteibaculum oceani]|uniref:Big-1 domain-containing protein n=1 Tax=Luteibaculum oceani TaxID=1294296 RepID=A0A5C6VKX8_9FLAO|nr:hypothetical protein [Luteibaculum oceani]TXC85414.1 hypothetical protein FRX97_01955 [Luteibaculum oceani]
MELKHRAVKFSFLAGIFAILTLSATFTTSCKKEDPTRVTITVRDTINRAVPGAVVRVYAKPTDSTQVASRIRFDESKITNSSGQVLFDYTSFTKPGQAGFAVLDIFAYKLSDNDPNDTLGIGIGQVRVEENKNNTKAIRIQ